MKNKNKFLSFLISLTVIISVLSLSMLPASAGMVNSNAGGGSVQVSSSVGGSVSIPLHEETPPLSHGMDIIRNRIELKKPALLNSDITFKPEEFERVLGIKRMQSITVTGLPCFTEGILTLAGSDVLEGQTISRENIQFIRLVPFPNRIGTINFTFRNTDDTTRNASIQCTISDLGAINFAPSANPISLTTQRNIPVFKNMDGNDPDNDNITYRIVQGPKKGLLEVIDAANGHFIYRPGKNFTGKDSFVYQVMDQYGNFSNPATAQIRVTKAASDVRFTDLTDHWAANAAVRAVAAGFIDADKNDPALMFEPDMLMTRAEFVEMTLRAAKLDRNMSAVFRTNFADDADIPVNYKPYVTKAYELGIVRGIPTETGLYFEPNSIITRAEAAVIVNNILKIPSAGSISAISSRPLFVDAVFIPEWAQDDIAALNSIGVIRGDENGNVNANGFLNRAQSVEMLVAMNDYTDSHTNRGGIFSFLFRR